MHGLFITVNNIKYFDDLTNSYNDSIIVWNLETPEIINILGVRWCLHSNGWALPEFILIYILSNGTTPKPVHTLSKKSQTLETPETLDVQYPITQYPITQYPITQYPIVQLNNDGRFISWYKNINEIISKFPEYNQNSIQECCNSYYTGDYTKCYGKYWCWDMLANIKKEIKMNVSIL